MNNLTPATLANGLLLSGWTAFLLALAGSLLAERLGPHPAQTSGLLLDGVGVAGTAGLYVGMVGMPEWWLAPGPWFSPSLALAGAGLLVGGLGLFGWARVTLGRWWSADVQIKQGQALCTRGPYTRVRHRIFRGFFAAGVGQLVISGQPAWVGGAGAITAYVLFKAVLEEQALAAHFGPAWTAYCRRVPALWPRIFRV